MPHVTNAILRKADAMQPWQVLSRSGKFWKLMQCPPGRFRLILNCSRRSKYCNMGETPTSRCFWIFLVMMLYAIFSNTQTICIKRHIGLNMLTSGSSPDQDRSLSTITAQLPEPVIILYFCQVSCVTVVFLMWNKEVNCSFGLAELRTWNHPTDLE